MDLLGPLPESPSKNSYVLVVSDYFTRYTEAYALPNQEAITVANKLVNEFFFRFSLPEQLHSDQGRQFESSVLKEVTNLLQIKKTRTTPYHPQSDGLVERFNRTLLAMLSTALGEHPWEWEDHIRQLCYAYNTSVHPGTGHSPFFLMFGRHPRLPVDLAFGLPHSEATSHSGYAQALQHTVQEAYKHVREDLGHHLKRQKELYDQKAHGKPHNKGDRVWLYNAATPKGKTKKFHKPWSGPYTIVKRLSDATYRIQLLSNPRKRVVVHFDRLKQFKGRINETDNVPGEPIQSSESRNNDSSQPTSNIGEGLELLEDYDNASTPSPGSSRRYPGRDHRPPHRYHDFVLH